jgi:hypothetical protein
MMTAMAVLPAFAVPLTKKVSTVTVASMRLLAYRILSDRRALLPVPTVLKDQAAPVVVDQPILDDQFAVGPELTVMK